MAAARQSSVSQNVAPKAPRATFRAMAGALGFILAIGILAAGCRSSSSKRAQAGAKTQPASLRAAQPMVEAGAFGTISGQLVPADGGAVVHFYKRDGSDAKYAFADPHSGSFTMPELPVDVYRVVVRPENPALEPRVIDDVVVPWGGREDVGAIDLRPAEERGAAAAGMSGGTSETRTSGETGGGAMEDSTSDAELSTLGD
jgi:hypothetical protein